MNKGGQFYLIAAIIIIGVILGFTTTTNSVKQNNIDRTKIYELFDEVNINNEKMVNYKDTSGYSEGDLKEIFDEFTDAYSAIEKIYIIIGKDGEVKLYEYNSNGITEKNDNENKIGQLKINKVIVKMEDVEYQFDRSDDFYFMVIKEAEGQQYIIQG